MKLLLVEADPDLAELLAYALGRDGYAVVTAADGEQGLHCWATEWPGAVVLEADLPKLDGLEVCRRIRQQARTPVVLLGGRAAEDDAVRALQAGADAYVAKPFSMAQLRARLAAVVRRAQPDPLWPAWQPGHEVRVGDLVLDREAHRVTVAGAGVRLTPVEFRLLWLLARHAGQVLPYGRLAELARRGRGAAGSGPLKAHISTIRQKVGLVPGAPGAIVAVPGVGYRLTPAG
jgi:DNA-binding response OmpR family regulator